MLKTVKTALRITTDKLDNEVVNLINACKKDLSLAGVKKINVNDPLIIRAIIIYARANFDSGVGIENFQKSYETLKCQLSLSGEYNDKKCSKFNPNSKQEK